uniref:Vesicle associated membrane protein 7 n=1 Tax=Naja naja TaxID=35670 RepID=A0A8C6XN23_NAJNA
MAILFAVVARGSTILAKHAWCGGNFLEVTEQILAKIPSENNKLTYSHGNYLFHYICQDRIIYLCITDDNFERSRAFTFLNEIKKRFQTTYGSRAQTALPYAMNSEFSSVLAAQLKYHSENKGPDQIVESQAQVDELKGIMVRNIGTGDKGVVEPLYTPVDVFGKYLYELRWRSGWSAVLQATSVDCNMAVQISPGSRLTRPSVFPRLVKMRTQIVGGNRLTL